MQTPLDTDPLPWMLIPFIPLDADPLTPEPLPPDHVTCDACWETNPIPPVNRRTLQCNQFPDMNNDDNSIVNCPIIHQHFNIVLDNKTLSLISAKPQLMMI